MSSKKNRLGFTLAEMLLAVAIILILMGVGFVAVNSYVRSLRLNEMDWTAKEIFIAAQNQLSKAKENGDLAKYKKSKGDSADNSYYVIYEDGIAKANSVKNDTPVAENSHPSAWEILMPFGAIDETVRLGGSYIIEFDLDAATVTQVYYSDNYSFTKYTSELKNGISEKGDRKDYGADHSIIGWYKGDAESIEFDAAVNTPGLEVRNEEKLSAKATNIGDDYYVLLCIRGMRSDATCTIKLEKNSNYEHLMDSVTSNVEEHFKNRIVSANNLKPFIPGEDIEIFVTARKSGVLSKVAESNHVITNSLFASTTRKNNETKAQIANFRHLENLDPKISGIEYGSETDSENKPTTAVNLIEAEQTKDMEWQDFLTKASSTGIVPIADRSSLIPNYYSVDLNINLIYEGNNRYIDGIIFSGTRDGGLFGAVSGKLIAKDLELRNFKIQSTGGHAGTLVGTSTYSSDTGLEVTNVIAYNPKAYEIKDGKRQTDADLYIESTAGSAGGLIGSATNATVTNCAAAVYVEGKTNAGGLIGTLNGGSVTKSYAGGHTDGGVFDFTVDKITSQDKGKGRINVYSSAVAPTGANADANAYAGGLIGKTPNDVTINNCYSTCSVFSNAGDAYSNFIVGNKTDTDTSNYGYGWLYKKDSGKPTPTPTPSPTVPEIIYPDYGMEIFTGDTTIEGRKRSTQKYNYDEFWDNEGFPYKTVNELSSADTDPWFIKNHVGDWAYPGYLVDIVNTPATGN